MATKDLSQDTLKSLMDTAKDQDGSLWDVGVSIHRTNAVPLDTSSIVFVDNICSNEDAWVTAAWEAAEAASSKATAHPGQQITVLGKIQDGDSYIGKAISFIVQPSPHSHTDYLLDASDADPKIEYSHETTVQELVYKSYVKKLDAELRHQIGNLSSIMNFYGVFESFSEANNAWKNTDLQPNPYLGKQIKPGDVIVITGTRDPQTGKLPIQNGSNDGLYNQATGKPGMEYVCSGFTDETPIWVELGFGSQIASFLGGDAGLTLPDTCPGIGKSDDNQPTTALAYIQAADGALASFIGGLDAKSNTFKLPETVPGGSETATNINTILGYIQKSDNTIADFIRPNNGSSGDNPELKPKLELPNALPDGNTHTAGTVIEYIQKSDEAITTFIGAKNPGFLPEELYTTETGKLGDTNKVDTVLKYIQASNKVLDQGILEEAENRTNADTAILSYIGRSGELPSDDDPASSLALPVGTKLPYPLDENGEPTADPTAETVIGFIVESDNSIKNELETEKQTREQDDKNEAKARSDADTAILDYIGSSGNLPSKDDSTSSLALPVDIKLPYPIDAKGNSTEAPDTSDTVISFIIKSDKSIKDELEIEKQVRDQVDQAELEARINADLAEQVRTTNTDASIIAGPSFVRTDDNKLQWKSETQTLTYNKAFAEISEEGQEYVKIEEESITSCNGETYYLVAVKKDESKTSFAEFKLEGTTKIPLRELAIFGQEFSSDSSEGCFYIYNSLCYVNEDYSLKEALGTITTTISTDVSENGNAGWWCVSNDTRTVPVDSLLQIMSNVANVRDTLKVVQKEFITIEHEQDSEDTCLCINLNTFTTNINSSY